MNFKRLYDYSQPLVAGATLLAIGLVIAAIFGSYAFYKIKVAANTIEVTGSAKEAVVSDFARWVISLETKTPVDDQQAGVDRLEQATAKISEYLKNQGFEDIETPTATINPDYIYREKEAPLLSGYNVYKQIIVKSNDIEKIAALAGNIKPLTGASYNVSTAGLEMTYQNLPEMRVKLLAGAIKDAEERAEAIAKETGRKVGPLKSATGGVVQVLPQGGVDISDAGSYDTMSKKKDVMVTVRASFILQ